MRSRYIIYGFAVMALYACTPKNNEVSEGDAGARISTRLQAYASAPTDFQEGDRIGVSARVYNTSVSTNRAWQYNNGVFIGEDSIRVEKGSELRLSAYYPYEAALDEAAPTITIDTRTDGYTDYLWATDTLTMSSSGMQAELRFRHVLARIECVFRPSAEYPQDGTLSFVLSGMQTKVEKNVLNGAETLSGEVVITRSTQPGQPVLIEIPAQSARPVISYEYAGDSYSVTPVTEQQYEAGRSYRYEIAFGPESDPTISLMQVSEQSTNFQLLPPRR